MFFISYPFYTAVNQYVFVIHVILVIHLQHWTICCVTFHSFIPSETSLQWHCEPLGGPSPLWESLS